MSAALVCIVRDESAGIRQFLAYHLGVMRFDRAVIYENLSTDDTRDQLDELTRHYNLTVVDWPYAKTADSNPQIPAYADALERLSGQVAWAAFLDGDEYLHSTAGWRLPELLASARHADQIALNWCVFGSSGHVAMPVLPTIEAFTRRAPLLDPCNRLCKVLVRSERAAARSPHFFDVPGLTVDGAGKAMTWSTEAPGLVATPRAVPFRVNHYMARSRAHWALRLARGQAISATRTEDDWLRVDRNEEEDTSAAHYYGPALRAELARINPMVEPVPHEWAA